MVLFQKEIPQLEMIYVIIYFMDNLIDGLKARGLSNKSSQKDSFHLMLFP